MHVCTACSKLSISFEQAVDNMQLPCSMLMLSDCCKLGCSNTFSSCEVTHCHNLVPFLLSNDLLVINCGKYGSVWYSYGISWVHHIE